MVMAEPSERAVLRNLQKEQERERRRIRDRERRKSMTTEEREKHLARRRRNYQLRRQKSANANPLITSSIGSQMLVVPSHDNQLVISTPVAYVRNDVIGSDAAQECSNAGREISAGLEVPHHALDELPRRSRLNHIKHLARSVNGPVDVYENLRVAAGVAIKGGASCSGLQQKGLRLIHVKQLPRASTTDVTRIAGQDHLCGKQDINCQLEHRELKRLAQSALQQKSFA